MAEATLVGSTKVSLIPDMSQFGDRLRIELPSAIREPAKTAGDTAGDLIRNAITKKLAKPIGVKVQASLDDAAAKASLKTLAKDRKVKVVVALDGKTATAGLAKLTKDRKVKIVAVLDGKTATADLAKLTKDRKVKVVAELDGKAATTALTKLTKDRKVTITAEIDDTAAKTKLGTLSGQQTVDILPKIQQAAYQTAMRQLDRLTADRTVNIRASVDTRVGANDIQNLIRRRTVRIGTDVDTRVAADSLANLTRRRQMTIQARADTTSADAAIRLASRDRTANIRVRATGLSALTAGLTGLGSSGNSSAGLGILSGRIAKIAAAALAAFPSIASLSSALVQMGPLAATAAPAVATLVSAFAAIKVGLSGVGDAIKAAFQPATGEATKAASATKAVETAQKSLATATRQLKDAQVQAAEQVKQANAQVASAERDLTEAQRDARQAQQDLTEARRQAVRDLQDMNNSLEDAQLDQRAATLAVQQAEEDLAAVRSDPTATQLQIQQATLARDQAVQSLSEQQLQTQRLQKDTAAANKAGVDGSKTVVQARQQVSDANQKVIDQQKALADAQAAVVKAQVDGQRQIADAQANVADAVKGVAEAQQAAAEQTSALDTAMAKLSPNAKAFVTQLQAMAPAWRSMKLDVQDALFAGIGTRLGQVGAQILPTVRKGLVGAATELNTMGRNALTAVSNLDKAGTLKGVFDGVRTSLRNLSRIPGQLVTAFAQLSVAAQPAFDRITTGFGSVMDKVMVKLAAGLKSGGLTDAINTALDVAIQFGKVLGNLGGIIAAVFKAAGAAGGDFFGVIGAAIAEIRKVVEMPEVQKALTAVFTAINAIARLIAGALGQAITAVLPVLAALAPAVTEVAKILGPALGQVIAALGDALMPIAQALGPVLVVAAKAVATLVVALIPLLQPLGEIVAALLPAFTPLLQTLTTVFTALAPVIAQVAQQIGPILLPVIQGLSKVLQTIVTQSATQFLKILQLLLPVIPQLVPVVLLLATSIGQILTAVAPLIPQITLLASQMLVQLLPALIPLIPPLTQLMLLWIQFSTMVTLKVVIPALKLLVSFLAGFRKAFQPALDAVTWLTKNIAKWFEWLYDHLLGHSVIPDIVNGATRWFTTMWKNVTGIFSNLKKDALKTWDSFWDNVRSVASTSQTKARAGFDKFAAGLKSAFKDARDGIGAVWKGLQQLVSNPIKFWIQTVYNNGIAKVWNATAAHIPGISNMKTIAVPKGMARGGVLPGWSTWRQGDDQLVPMRRGEGVYVSEVMRDPYERARLHAMNAAAIRGTNPSMARMQYGFSEGGIFGGLTSIGSGIADTVGSVLKKGANAVRGGLADVAATALKPVKAGITKALGASKNTWPGVAAQAPLYLIDKAIDYIRNKDVPDASGQWIKPVNVPFGTKFGAKGSMWSSGRHTGLDFPAAVGTKVVAVDNGTVESAVSGGPYGKHVMISHGGGLESLYAHMSAIAARVGTGIKQGARVGSVGATGNVTGPHLHLEARVHGKSVDPMPYLTGGGDGGSGVQRWKGVVTQALGQVHQSLSLVNTTLRRMNQESGGNPTAVNRTDSNWKAGHPSVGLMQLIEGTFRAYAGPYKNTGPKLYGVSTDPLANIYASMRYALSRYGSLSAAYNRPGGYARGGLVGGTRIHRGTPRGYAGGGIIKVGGKSIDTGPIASAVGASFLKQLAGTAAQISSAMTSVATAVKNAFKGVKTTLDNKLLTQISTTNKQLQALATQRDAIASKITAANQLAADSTSQATSFAALTGLPNAGNAFDAGGVLSGLQTRLTQIKAFTANLKILGARGLDKTLLSQIEAAGIDQGAAYAQALVDATPAQLKSINSTESQIASAATSYGKTAADAMYDAGTQSGQGYLTGLKAQEASIDKAMSTLAKKIQAAIKKALKIKSPSRVFAELGAFTVAGFAQGVTEATPQAAAATAGMASTVRSSAAAATSVSSATSTTNSTVVGDRHLHYNATVREQASRQSLLAALALEDTLHRPVVVGG
ncbi:peptidoglycan DD-metalloendopeptidase family protein [Streptomyces sp. NPDC008150]|uniref:peptidoglycan DD-metalloendopeptidase family protein n=1 Tax=Streptomyces sp. NPDC008150 TaxID=3364816 RepID=UPI0036F0BD10